MYPLRDDHPQQKEVFLLKPTPLRPSGDAELERVRCNILEEAEWCGGFPEEET